MFRILTASALLALMMLAGLWAVGWTRKDYRKLHDEQVENIWTPGRELVDAVEFFHQGGVFESMNSDSATNVDQDYVVPLVNRLQQEHELEPQMIVNPSEPLRAFALVARVPADRDSRNAIRTSILAAGEEFPGLLYQKWGHQWLALEFFGEDVVAEMKRAGVFHKLKAGQRRWD